MKTNAPSLLPSTTPCVRALASLIALAAATGCSSAEHATSGAATTSAGTGAGTTGGAGASTGDGGSVSTGGSVGTGASAGDGGGVGTGGSLGTGGNSGPGAPTPAIFSVTDQATLALAKALTGEAPFAVHVSALEDVPEPCLWTPPDKTTPCNPESGTCQPDSATPAAESQAIWSCLRARDAAYDACMSTKYLGGGDLLDAHFEWDFGDASGAWNEVAGFSAAHVYDAPGTYSMKLRVKNGSGAYGTVTVPVTVTASTRPVVQIATDAALAQVLAAPPSGTKGRQIALQRGATYHITSGAFTLVDGDWLTTYGDPKAAAPILDVAYPACGSSCYIKLFAVDATSHVLIEGMDVRIANGTQRPFLAEPNGVDVVFRDIVTSDGPTWTGPSRAFTLQGRGQLVQNVGAPRNADGSWASSGLSANFAFMTGQNTTLYGNHVYVDASDGNAEPGVRSCGSSVAFLAVVGNDIGGWFGKSSTISIRSGQNVYFGSDNVMWGTFDFQTGCSPNTFQFSTHDVVVEDSYLQNELFQVNPGVYNLAFRDNVLHRQNVNGSAYPLPVSISLEISGGTAPWSTDRMELVGNTFLFEPNVGKLGWFLGGPALTRVDLVNNVFYAPAAAEALEASRPTQVANPWDFLGTVSGNAFFLGSKEPVASLSNGSAGSSLSLAQWNQIKPTSGASPADVSFASTALGLPVLASQAISNDVIESVTECRPSATAPWAASGSNLLTPSGAGTIDARGVESDLTGRARPSAGKGGWTPGALQAE